MPEILSLKQKSQKRNKSRFSQIPIYISITLSQKKVKATPHKKMQYCLDITYKTFTRLTGICDRIKYSKIIALKHIISTEQQTYILNEACPLLMQ